MGLCYVSLELKQSSQALASRSLTAEEGAHLQKRTKNAEDIIRPDDTTFKAGVAASKEGNKDPEKRISNPKEVVAKANTDRQARESDKA